LNEGKYDMNTINLEDIKKEYIEKIKSIEEDRNQHKNAASPLHAMYLQINKLYAKGKITCYGDNINEEDDKQLAKVITKYYEVKGRSLFPYNDAHEYKRKFPDDYFSHVERLSNDDSEQNSTIKMLILTLIFCKDMVNSFMAIKKEDLQYITIDLLEKHIFSVDKSSKIANEFLKQSLEKYLELMIEIADKYSTYKTHGIMSHLNTHKDIYKSIEDAQIRKFYNCIVVLSAEYHEYLFIDTNYGDKKELLVMYCEHTINKAKCLDADTIKLLKEATTKYKLGYELEQKKKIMIELLHTENYSERMKKKNELLEIKMDTEMTIDWILGYLQH